MITKFFNTKYFFIIFFSSCLFGQYDLSVFSKADSFYRQLNYSEAIKEYLKVLQNAETDINIDNSIRATIRLGICNYRLNERAEALNWYRRALALAQKKPSDSLRSEILYYISVIYNESKIVDSAEYYSQKATAYWKSKKKYTRLATALAALSDIYVNTKDVQKARATISEAEYYAQLSGEVICRAFVAMKWYFFYSLLYRDYRKALYWINQAEELYLKTGNLDGIQYAYSFKATCLAKLGDTLAADYIWKWFKFKDSVFHLEKAAHIAKYQTLFETEKKKREIELLRKKEEQTKLMLLVVAAAMVFFIILSLWLLNRYRLQKKEQEVIFLQKLQEDKERIARDLHDSTGGLLSYIYYSLDNLREVREGNKEEVVDQLKQSVRTIIANLREVIWATAGSSIEIFNLSDKLKVYAKNLFQNSSTTLHYTEEILASHKLGSLTGLNIYRICQEVLHNAFKHAQAKDVYIHIFANEKMLNIKITDNGKGFDRQKISGGYGLKNIEKRTKDYGIEMTFYSSPEKGTTYTFTFLFKE